MSTPVDKECVDSRLETISTSMLGDVRAVTLEMAGERKSFEAKMDGHVSLIKEILEKRLAESAANQHKSSYETLKWVLSINISIAALGLAYLTFVINNVAPKAPASAPAPVVIYTQPAPAAPAAPVAPAVPSATPKT